MPIFEKFTCVIIFFLFCYMPAFSQAISLQGIVKDESTLKPIPEVNIKVLGTTNGTSTDKAGRFTIKVNKKPVTIIISCIGYETEYFNILNISNIPIEFTLVPKSYSLQEVEISSKNYSLLFKDKEYSILDYELMEDNILLIIYRTKLKRSEIVLLSRNGDTLAITNLPEVPPKCLFKDFLSNVHYFSKSGNAYQCYYNSNKNSIEFLYKTSSDSLLTHLKLFIFKLADRIYFQEIQANGFGTAIGFYEKGIGKTYIKKYLNTKKIAEYKDDQLFYQNWNIFLATSKSTHTFNSGNNYESSDDNGTNLMLDNSGSEVEGGFYGKNEARAHQIEYFSMIYPVIKTRDNNIAFLNFFNDSIEVMNMNGKAIDNIPLTFHRGQTNKKDTSSLNKETKVSWRWGNKILVDHFTYDIYTTFLRNGMVKIQKIDLTSGALASETILPFPYPEKILIYKGEAYFLNKDIGESEKWRLIKCKLK